MGEVDEIKYGMRRCKRDTHGQQGKKRRGSFFRTISHEEERRRDWRRRGGLDSREEKPMTRLVADPIQIKQGRTREDGLGGGVGPSRARMMVDIGTRARA